MADDKKICTRCKLPAWTHELWPCTPRHMAEYVGDDEMRREVVLRELNQGALAGMPSAVTEHAVDLVLAVVNRYDEWKAARLSAEPDEAAIGRAADVAWVSLAGNTEDGKYPPTQDGVRWAVRKAIRALHPEGGE